MSVFRNCKGDIKMSKSKLLTALSIVIVMCSMAAIVTTGCASYISDARTTNFFSGVTTITRCIEGKLFAMAYINRSEQGVAISLVQINPPTSCED